MTTTTPTLATLRATLAAAERRLAAANDEVDAAQEAHDDATAALAAAYEALDVCAANVHPSSIVDGGWDVDITLVDTDGSTVAEGEVTLVVADYNGRPAAYTGSGLDTWVSHGLIGTLTGHRVLVDAVEAVAREAIEASDVDPSPEHEG